MLSDWTEREYRIVARFLNREATPEGQPFTFDDVRRVLSRAVAGGEVTALHGDFWNRVSRDDFIRHKVLFAGGEIPVVRRFDGANSALVQALRGSGPFKDFRMPQMRELVDETDVARIEKWIDDGCP